MKFKCSKIFMKLSKLHNEYRCAYVWGIYSECLFLNISFALVCSFLMRNLRNQVPRNAFRNLWYIFSFLFLFLFLPSSLLPFLPSSFPPFLPSSLPWALDYIYCDERSHTETSLCFPGSQINCVTAISPFNYTSSSVS